MLSLKLSTPHQEAESVSPPLRSWVGEGRLGDGFSKHYAAECWTPGPDYKKSQGFCLMLSLGTADLKQTDSQIFSQQNGFIQKQPRILIQDMQSNGACPEKQRKGMGVGGAIESQESIGGN